MDEMEMDTTMETLENEVKDLKDKNTELVQEVQFWKVSAAQKEKEKLELMKEVNELRLKLSRLRSGGSSLAEKLDAGLQTASEEALTHLVQASGAVARTLELVKQYIRDRDELESSSLRWSSLSNPASAEKVHRVPPLLMGGQSIQPVVSLSRTMFNSSIRSRSPNQNTNVTERAVPMHMLQDVYIPLTRIDMAELAGSLDTSAAADNSATDMGLNDTEIEEHETEDSDNITDDNLDTSRRLDDVMEEETEPEEEPQTPRSDNPLEGPSWLLDVQSFESPIISGSRPEPDSTTSVEAARPPSPSADVIAAPSGSADASTSSNDDAEKENSPRGASLAFTPTLRRKRSPPPPLSPRHSRPNSGRVLKVMVAKMRMSAGGPGASGDGSPPKRRSTDIQPDTSNNMSSSILSTDESSSCASDVSSMRGRSRGARGSVGGEEGGAGGVGGRTRRVRKNVTYKEKPLNRKMRR